MRRSTRHGGTDAVYVLLNYHRRSHDMMPRHFVDVRRIVVRAGTGYIPMSAMHDTVICPPTFAHPIREPQSDACIPLGIGVKMVVRLSPRRTSTIRREVQRPLHDDALPGPPSLDLARQMSRLVSRVSPPSAARGDR